MDPVIVPLPPGNDDFVEEHAHATQHHFVLIKKEETKSATVDDETNRKLQNQWIKWNMQMDGQILLRNDGI